MSNVLGVDWATSEGRSWMGVGLTSARVASEGVCSSILTHTPGGMGYNAPNSFILIVVLGFRNGRLTSSLPAGAVNEANSMVTIASRRVVLWCGELPMPSYQLWQIFPIAKFAVNLSLKFYNLVLYKIYIVSMLCLLFFILLIPRVINYWEPNVSATTTDEGYSAW